MIDMQFEVDESDENMKGMERSILYLVSSLFIMEVLQGEKNFYFKV